MQSAGGDAFHNMSDYKFTVAKLQNPCKELIEAMNWKRERGGTFLKTWSEKSLRELYVMLSRALAHETPLCIVFTGRMSHNAVDQNTNLMNTFLCMPTNSTEKTVSQKGSRIRQMMARMLLVVQHCYPASSYYNHVTRASIQKHFAPDVFISPDYYKELHIQFEYYLQKGGLVNDSFFKFSADDEERDKNLRRQSNAWESGAVSPRPGNKRKRAVSHGLESKRNGLADQMIRVAPGYDVRKELETMIAGVQESGQASNHPHADRDDTASIWA